MQRNAKDQFVRIKGKDTYVNPGSEVNSLSLEAKARDDFYRANPDALALIRRSPHSPLVIEEVAATNPGEDFIPVEALALLIEKEILQHKHKKGSTPYNSKNVFLVNNNYNQLAAILSKCKLAADEDIKGIFVDAIHSISFYVRREGDTIRAFIVDSEGSADDLPHSLIKTLKFVFPQIDIVLSSAVLQKDFYSCTTFAFKTLKYFVKHGSEVFKHIDSIEDGISEDLQTKCKVLKPQYLMPALLKMSQLDFALSEEAKQTIVSRKNNLTLAAYQQQYELKLDGKKYNSAALQKKYKYIARIQAAISKFRLTGKILDDAAESLPIPLHRIQERLTHAPNKKIQKTPVLLICKEIVFYLNKQNECKSQVKPAATTATLLASITAGFPQFLEEYTNFSATLQPNSESNILAKIIFISFYAHGIEKGRFYEENPHIQAQQYAEKLICLFQTHQQAIKYLIKYFDPSANQPVHDLCLFNLPEPGLAWNKLQWAEFIHYYGTQAAKYLPMAYDIEEKLKEKHATFDLIQIKKIAKEITYRYAHENKIFATECVEHNRTEAQFAKHILTTRYRKKEDLLPDITVKLPNYPGFTFLKLPIDDVRGWFLGEYTDCCQSLDKHAEHCAIHGMSHPYAGFYVMINNRGRIIGQTYAWLGLNGEIVFDSWEYINKPQKELFAPFLKAAAEQLLSFGFSKVLIGTGGKTPDTLVKELKEAKEPAKQRGVLGYGDSSTQAILGEQHFPAMPLKMILQHLKQHLADPDLKEDELFDLFKGFYKSGHFILHELIKQDKILFFRCVAKLGKYGESVAAWPNEFNQSLLFTAEQSNDPAIIQAVNNLFPTKQQKIQQYLLADKDGDTYFHKKLNEGFNQFSALVQSLDLSEIELHGIYLLTAKKSILYIIIEKYPEKFNEILSRYKDPSLRHQLILGSNFYLTINSANFISVMKCIFSLYENDKKNRNVLLKLHTNNPWQTTLPVIFLFPFYGDFETFEKYLQEMSQEDIDEITKWQTQVRHENIFHHIIHNIASIHSKNYRTRNDYIIASFRLLFKILTPPQIKKLMRQQNCNGMTPIHDGLDYYYAGIAMRELIESLFKIFDNDRLFLQELIQLRSQYGKTILGLSTREPVLFDCLFALCVKIFDKKGLSELLLKLNYAFSENETSVVTTCASYGNAVSLAKIFAYLLDDAENAKVLKNLLGRLLFWAIKYPQPAIIDFLINHELMEEVVITQTIVNFLLNKHERDSIYNSSHDTMKTSIEYLHPILTKKYQNTLIDFLLKLDEQGLTILHHLACSNNNIPVAQYIFEKMCSDDDSRNRLLNAVDKHGRKPNEYARAEFVTELNKCFDSYKQAPKQNAEEKHSEIFFPDEFSFSFRLFQPSRSPLVLDENDAMLSQPSFKLKPVSKISKKKMAGLNELFSSVSFTSLARDILLPISIPRHLTFENEKIFLFFSDFLARMKKSKKTERLCLKK